MDTSSKKSLNQFGSVDGCNHTHHIHHIHHNTIPLIPTHHTIPKQSTHAQTHSRPYNPDRNSERKERKLIPKFSTTTSNFFSLPFIFVPFELFHLLSTYDHIPTPYLVVCIHVLRQWNTYVSSLPIISIITNANHIHS